MFCESNAAALYLTPCDAAALFRCGLMNKRTVAASKNPTGKSVNILVPQRAKPEAGKKLCGSLHVLALHNNNNVVFHVLLCWIFYLRVCAMPVQPPDP